MASINDVVAHYEKKEIRFLLDWRGHFINFGKATFSEDGSFYYSSAFHNDKELIPTIEWGISRLIGNEFILGKASAGESNARGMHFSLHPRGQLMQVREQNGGKILYKRPIPWFPVTKPFNLLRAYSLPLSVCKPTTRKSGLIMPIPDEYENSVELIIDLFPRGTEVHHPYVTSVWQNWGYCPEYLVRASFNFTNQKTPALILWPESDDLTL